LLEEERDWLDELQSTRDGRFKGDSERDGISQDRQASVGDFGALADIDTKWEKVANVGIAGGRSGAI
jgi:hypothetical protein